MGITAYCIRNPVGVMVAAAIILFVGLISILGLPIQLTPPIDRPTMSVTTTWRAAAPNEVESEILEPIEKVLRGIPGLREMTSSASTGQASIRLEFGLQTSMEAALIDVTGRLNRLRPLPADADKPQLRLADTSDDSTSLAWFFIQLLPDNTAPLDDYYRFIDDQVVPRLESVPGVSAAQVFRPAGKAELQIIFDPYRVAALGIDIPRIAALAGQATDVSGGQVDVGRRQYTLRFKGRFSPRELAGLIIDWRGGQPVRLGDIAQIRTGRAEAGFTVFQNGNRALAIRLGRETDANVLETLGAVNRVVAGLRDGPLAERGLGIEISFDATVFIERAITLLAGNLALGVLLATGILWWFLRHLRGTLLIALAVPVSVMSTSTVLFMAGRSLNVISLAGLAFSVGMVMDAAIVVLENIIRLREKGRSPEEAAAQGAAQVWGALLASTVTTVAIFVPVLYLKDASGQLFEDLALTIAIGVSVSLLVAVTILPAAASRWLGGGLPRDSRIETWNRMAKRIIALTATPSSRLAWVGGLIAFSSILSITLLPPFDYLPPVKRDAVDANFIIPPGSTVKSLEDEIFKVMIARLKPYMDGEKEPALKNYYLGTFGGGQFATLGARARDQSRAGQLEKLLRDKVLPGFPDLKGNVSRSNLFGGFGQTGNIAIHLQTGDLDALYGAGNRAIQLIQDLLPGATLRPPAIAGMDQPELLLSPRDERLSEVGWSRFDLARIIRAMGDGLWLGEYFDGEDRLDIILKSTLWDEPETLAEIPLATPSGAIVPLGDLVTLQRTVGPQTLNRVDGRRSLTIRVQPAPGVSLQETLDIIRSRVEPALKAALPADGGIRYGGSADDLDNAISSMSANFALALALLFLLMAALFRSLRDAALVVIAIPLATVGGVIALRLLNLFTFQPLDLLTMIGFIILLGLVVNNAILLVHQTRRGEAAGLSRAEAVEESLRRRLRPIFMSTLTSIFGMMPLLLFPGEGSAIYRGLAAAIVGGMAVSTLFTLILLPALMRMGREKPLRRLVAEKI